MTRSFRVGLTGGIGSGKTTVCNLFAKFDVPIIDADIISHEITKPGHPGLDAILQEFGPDILDENKELNRPYMRQVIFNNDNLRQKLESILHPLVYSEMEKQSQASNAHYCILSIPLLFESGGEKHVDRILVVDTDENIQIERASKRDHTDQQSIIKIIESQISRKERLKEANDVIENSGDLSTLEKQVELLHQNYLELARNSLNADKI